MYGVRRALEQDGELVAAEPGDGVRRADALEQPDRHALEEQVAGRVPELVVDELEVVEVAVEHADRGLGVEQRAVEPVGEQHPVGEPGQRVVQGLVLELVAGRAEGHEQPLVVGDREELPGEHQDHERGAEQQVDRRGRGHRSSAS